MPKKDEDFANLSFRDFYDNRRGSDAFRDRVADVDAGMGGPGTPQLKLVGAGDNPNTPFDEGEGDHWSFGDDQFTIMQNVRGARSLVAAYALYRRRVLKAGGTPSAFERPTKDGWE